MSTAKTISEANIEGLNLMHSGKVRDVYEIDDHRLLLVATDRISAFDCILPTPVPQKGGVLTQLSAFWFRKLEGVVDNHLISINTDDMPLAVSARADLVGRSTLVRRTTVFPVECVVR